jgi:hypothetical protein
MSVDLQQELRRVRSDHVREEYSSRVKTLFADYVQALDPDARIENTNYFNHSAIPDFILSWPDQRAKRGLYLRGSYAAILAANELGGVAGIDPIYLALDPLEEFELSGAPKTRESIREAADLGGHHTLLTDVTAVATLGESDPSQESPLVRLVKSNFVRGGRGLIDAPRVSSLAGIDGPEHNSQPIGELIRESFSEEAAYRMERTAAILELATSDASPDITWDDRVSGRLSKAEIRAVIPWLLTDPATTSETSFWRSLARRIDFADLETEIDSLRGLDLTRLLEPNADLFLAGRAYAGLFLDGVEDGAVAGWQVIGKTIARHVGQRAARFAVLGTKLKAGGTHREPSWDMLSEALGQNKLERVTLHGVTRSVSIGAEQSEDIGGDAQQIVSSLGDTYFVSDVALRFVEMEPEPRSVTVDVDFGSRLAVAASPGTASLASLMAALSLIDEGLRDASQASSE